MKVAAANSVEELESFELDATGKPGEDAVRAYERDGVVCLRGAFSDDWIEQGRRAIAAVIRTRSYSDQHATHQKKGELGNFLCNFTMVENVHSPINNLSKSFGKIFLDQDFTRQRCSTTGHHHF